MAGMKDGNVVSVEDEPLEWEPHAALREKLYITTPPGLDPSRGDVPDLPTKAVSDSLEQRSLENKGKLELLSSTAPIPLHNRGLSRAAAAGLARQVLQHCMSATDPYSYA